MRPWRVIAALLAGACGGESQRAADSPDDFGPPWSTEGAFEIGEGASGGGEAAFSLISRVRVLENGRHVLVVEPSVFRVTLWTPEGSLVRDVGGPGEGPGEFSGTLFVEVHRDGFRTRDAQRYSSFSNDGSLIGTVPFPPRGLGFRGFPLGPQALLHDGSFLATSRVPAEALAGSGGDAPIEHLPVYRVSGQDDDWTMETIAMLDTRNRDMHIRPEGTPFELRGIRVPQFFGDFDLTWFDPDAGSVVVLRRNLGGGAVELTEIEADGDTLWRRRVAPAPVPLDPGRLDTYIDEVAGRYAAALGGGDAQSGMFEAIRDAIAEAVYVPDPLPGATLLHGTSTGEVWFRGHQRQDTLSVWHALDRDGVGGRIVLIPSRFRPMDATDTHVWGVRTDELGVQYVVGRRLVPPQDPEG